MKAHLAGPETAACKVVCWTAGGVLHHMVVLTKLHRPALLDEAEEASAPRAIGHIWSDFRQHFTRQAIVPTTSRG